MLTVFRAPIRVQGVVPHLLLSLLFALVLTVVSEPGYAQDGLQPGEGYLTRFSGTKTEGDTTVIDTDGTVGSVIDLRNPAQAPRGQHWLNEPQLYPVTAAQIGQVFGIASRTSRHTSRRT